MKTLALLIALLCSSPAWASFTIGHANPSGAGGVTLSGGAGTVLTLTSVASGHGVMGVVLVGDTTTTLASCTATSSTCVVVPHSPTGGSGGSNSCGNVTGSGGRVECFYILSTGATITSVTIVMSGSVNGCAWYVIDYSFTSGPLSFDTSCSAVDSVSTLSPAGCTLAMSGANDVRLDAIFPANTASGTPTGWTNACTASCGGNGAADRENTTNSAAPVWTQAPTGTAVVGGFALKEAGGAGVVRHRAWVIQSQ